MKFFFIVFSFLVVGFVQAETQIDRFHICTIATYKHPNLYKLIKSCEIHKINLEVLAKHQPYHGNGIKFLYMLEYLNTLQDDEIVMFVDAFDVLMVMDKRQILQKFLKMNIPFLMAAETNCAPYAELAESYPPSPTPFRYINTGTFIGYVKNLKEWLINLQPIDPYGCDQGQATLNFLNTPENERHFKLDYHCELFLPLFGVSLDWISVDKKDYIFRCTKTHSTPCLIHANGASFHIWNIVFEKLFKQNVR